MPLDFQIGNRLLDDAQVIVQGCQQDVGNVQRPRFAKESADGRMRIDQGFDVGVVFGPAFDAAGGTEGCDERILPFEVAGALEEFNVLGVGAGPAAFDEGHAKAVEPVGDADFVVGRKREAFGLGAVS